MSTVSFQVTDRSGLTASRSVTFSVSTGYDLIINPGQDAVALVNAAPAGTQARPYRILINGNHWIKTAFAPKADQELTFTGTISGTVPVTGWVPDGARWSVTGTLPASYTEPNGKPEFTTGKWANVCRQREDLHLNGQFVKPVSALTHLDADTCYRDYTANKIYVGTDPTGKAYSLSRTPYAIRTTAPRVRLLLAGAVFQGFATPNQTGALQLEGPDCFVEGGTVQWVHAIGLRLVNSHRTVVKNFDAWYCGQLGIACTSSDNTQRLSSRAKYCNTAGFDPGDWESGGEKATRSTGTYRWDCDYSNNYGIGLWDDIDNVRPVTRWCNINDNAAGGYRAEIGYSAELGWCKVNRNGLLHRPDSGQEIAANRDPGPFATSGVGLNSNGNWDDATGRVWVHDCEILDNRNGLFAQERVRTRSGPKYPDWPWQLRGVLFEGNTVRSAILINPATGKQWVDANSAPTSSMSGVGALGVTAARSAEIWTTGVVSRNNKYAATELIMRWTGTAWRAGSLVQAQAAGQEKGSVVL